MPECHHPPDSGPKFQLGEGGLGRHSAKSSWSRLPYALCRQTTSGGLMPSVSAKFQVSVPVPAADTHKSQLLSMETRRNSGLLCQQKATGARLLTQAVASRGHHQIPASHMTVNILLITSPSNSCPTKGGNRTQHATHVPSRPSGQPCPGSSIAPILNQGPRQSAPPRLLGADDHSTLNKKKKNIPHGRTSLCCALTRPTQVPSKKKKKKTKSETQPI